MHLNTEIHDICEAIAREVKLLVKRMGSGGMSRDEFIEEVLAIEEERVRRNQLVLIASNTLDDWTRFTLLHQGSPEICAAFECLPETGEFRKIDDPEAC